MNRSKLIKLNMGWKKMEFDEHQILLENSIARFGKEQVGPLASEIDEEERFPLGDL